jgi:O-antigen/teichoic acid export membrane protein
MSVKRNLIANYLASGWSSLVGLALLPAYIHYLGMESYGLIGFFLTLQAWLALLDMGLGPTLNREMARFSAGSRTPQSIRNLLKSVQVIYGCIALGLGLAVAALSSRIATEWLNLQALSPQTASYAIALMGVVIALQWQGSLYRSALLGLQDQVWLNGVSIAIVTLRGVGTLAVLAWLSPTIVAFFFLQCGTSLAETGVLALRVHRRLPAAPHPGRFSPTALREISRFAAGLAGIAVLATLLTQVDKLLLAKLLPLDQFGHFSLAVAVAGVLSVAVGPIHNVAYPRLSELVAAGDAGAVSSEYHRFAQLMSTALLPPMLMLAAFSREIVELWTQDPAVARAVAPIVSVWAVGTALNGVMHVPYAAQLAHGWSRLMVVVNLVAVAVLVPATLLLVPTYGAAAAAWIWVATNAGYLTVAVALMHRRILRGEKWSWYVQDLLRPLAPGVLCILAITAAHRHLPGLSRPEVLAFLLLATALVFVTVLAATPAGLSILRAVIAPVLPAAFRANNERS